MRKEVPINRGLLGHFESQPRIILWGAQNQTISTSVHTWVTWLKVIEDNTGMFDRNLKTSFLIKRAGFYMVAGEIIWDNASPNTLTRSGYLKKIPAGKPISTIPTGGTTIARMQMDATAASQGVIIPIAGIFYFNSGDRVGFAVYQDSGASQLIVGATAGDNYISAVRLS